MASEAGLELCVKDGYGFGYGAQVQVGVKVWLETNKDFVYSTVRGSVNIT